MNNKIKLSLCLALTVVGLSSCSTVEDGTSVDINYPAYSSYDTRQVYMQDDSSMINDKYSSQNASKKEVVVPDSYYISEYRSPVSFREQEDAWVTSQNPQAYTIELAEGDKPAQVAQELYKAPKNNRMAQLKSERDGKEYYRGVYGTYSNAADAQKALDALPSEIKSKALIKSWGSIQP